MIGDFMWSTRSCSKQIAVIYLGLLPFFTQLALAGSIAAELSSTESDLSEPVSLSVTIEGDTDDEIQLPEISGLVIEQHGTSISKSYTNGHLKSEKQVQFSVYAQKSGDYVIPSISMTIDGKKEATLPLKLRFSNAGEAAKSPGDHDQSGGDDSKARKMAEEAQQAAKKADTAGVFIERECNKTDPYVGEQVLCSVRVYDLGNLTAAQRLNQASSTLRHFSVEGEKRFHKIVGQQRYRVIELKEVLIATEAGKIDVPPFVLEARVMQMRPSRRSIDQLFNQLGGGAFNFGEEKEVKVSTQPLTFDVKPLPDKDRPTTFSGLVGKYNLTANASKSTAKTGETVTITQSISGHGLLDSSTLAAPELAKIGRIYADKPEYKETVNGEQGLNSNKTFKYALVPNKAGSFNLGTIDVPVFDPELGQYVHLTADLGPLVVEPGAAEEKPLVVGQLGQGTSPGKEAVKELSEDLIGLHTAANDLLSQARLTSSEKWRLVSLGGLPLSLALGFLGLHEFRRRQKSDEKTVRRSRAMQKFRESLKNTSLTIDSGDRMAALAQLERAFKIFIGDKLSIAGAALTPKEIGQYLRDQKVPDTVVTSVVTLLRDLEKWSLADPTTAASGTSDQAQKSINQLESLAQELDKTC